MPKLIDITGMQFGRLTVIKRDDNSANGASRWVCICECGTHKTIAAKHLKSGNTQSCGCYRKSAFTTHGMFGTSTYNVWGKMISRCTNKNDISYPRYGGRGIKVCQRWKIFENFFADMGRKPKGLSLDRINNNAGYSPDNCKWSSTKEQNNNTRKAQPLTHNRITKTAHEWSIYLYAVD